MKIKNNYLTKSLICIFYCFNIFGQCNWIESDIESFEFNTPDPNVITGVSYGNTPQTYPGCVHSGNNGMYLNFTDGYIGLAYKKVYSNLCVDSDYKISLFVRDTWGNSNNCSYTVKDASGITITTQTISNTGNNWVNVILNFTPSTPTISFEISTIMVGAPGNDLGFDDIVLSLCKPEVYKYTSILCLENSDVKLYTEINSKGFSKTGIWTGPSQLSGNYLGEFNATTNILGKYSYNVINQCQDSLAEVTVSQIIVEAGEDITVCDDQLITLNASGGSSYIWSNSIVNNQPFKPIIIGEYTVVGTDTNGCSASDFLNISFCESLTPPNVFTPNGDGINDTYNFNLKFIKNVEMIILNRWGNIVFQEENINPVWNGKDIKGNILPSGVYFYKYTAIDYYNKTINGNGFIHLVN